MEFGSGYSVNNTLFNYVDNFTNFTPVSAMVTRGSYIGTIPAVCDALGINAIQFLVLFNPIVDGEHVCNSLGMIADYDNVAVYYIASRYNAGTYSKKFSNGVTRKWEISIVRKNDLVPELFQFGGDTFNNNINLLPNNGYMNANTREYIGNAFYHYSAKRYGATWTYSGLNNSRYIPPAPENVVQNVSYNGSNFISSKRLSQKVLIEWNEASDETTLPLRLGYIGMINDVCSTSCLRILRIKNLLTSIPRLLVRKISTTVIMLRKYSKIITNIAEQTKPQS